MSIVDSQLLIVISEAADLESVSNGAPIVCLVVQSFPSTSSSTSTTTSDHHFTSSSNDANAESPCTERPLAAAERTIIAVQLSIDYNVKMIMLGYPPRLGRSKRTR